MKDYPEKCPECKMDKEPIFDDESNGRHLGSQSISIPNQDSIKWLCANISCKRYEGKRNG